MWGTPEAGFWQKEGKTNHYVLKVCYVSVDSVIGQYFYRIKHCRLSKKSTGPIPVSNGTWLTVVAPDTVFLDSQLTCLIKT